MVSLLAELVWQQNAKQPYSMVLAIDVNGKTHTRDDLTGN
jgi:hypothetical protein